MIQGTASSAGKTTLVTALCRIFTQKGFKVSPFKAQNMSNYAYSTKDFEISRAQAIQAIAARTEILPEQNPILLKPLGNYRSSVFTNGKFFKKMHASDYYTKFVNKTGLQLALNSYKQLEKNHDLIISVPKSEWKSGLENAMEYYIKKEEYEECTKIKKLIERL